MSVLQPGNLVACLTDCRKVSFTYFLIAYLTRESLENGESKIIFLLLWNFNSSLAKGRG